MKICAVITSFNIGNEFRENFLSYVNDLDYLVIVDNSSNEDTKEMLRDLAKDYQHKVNLVINDQNLGLARAQNIGVRIALELSYDFILSFDTTT